jgi:hypothetical protein
MNPEPFFDQDLPDDLRPLEPLEPSKMPPPVIGALAIACIFIGLQILGNVADEKKGPFAPTTIVSTIVGGLIIGGFLFGHRLAWQWGRVLGLFYGTFLAIIFLVAVNAGKAGQIPVLITTAVPSALLITMGALLGIRSARAYFRLICPECRSAEAKADDFFFNRAKCKACGRVW